MKYLTCSEVSAMMGTTARRVQQMCKNGEIIGAIKKGRSWMVPTNAIPGKQESFASVKKAKPFPIGIHTSLRKCSQRCTICLNIETE